MKKKGFTLLELLAVVVLLAILALMVTPNVLNVIENSRRGVAEENARVIAKTAETYYAQQTLLHNNRIGEIDLTSDTLTYNGNKPYKGYVYFDDSGKAYIKMYQNGYCVVGDYDNKTNAIKMEAKDCKINSFIIFIELNGGKLDNNIFEYEQGDTFGELPTPTKDGYIFIGWFDKNGKEITSDTRIDKSSTIYAQWEANKYVVTLKSDNINIPDIDGWNIIDGEYKKEIYYDKAYGNLPLVEKKGHNFLGWYTIGGVKITSETLLKIPSDHILTAQFEPMKYLVTFNYNVNGIEDSIKEITYGDVYGELPSLERTGYSFLGWYDINGDKIESSTVVSVLSNQELEAQWKAKKYTITFESNGGTDIKPIEVIYDLTYGTLPEPTKEGYTFIGWSTIGGMNIESSTIVTITDNMTLYAQWGKNNYLITFDANGGEVVIKNTTITFGNTYGNELGELPIPEKNGYTFSGWYTDKISGKLISKETIMNLAFNHSLYARWTANKYTVTFVFGNGSLNTTKTVTYDSKYGDLPSATRDDHTFAGWYTTSGVLITSETIVKINSSQTLYAQWLKNVVFPLDNGSIVYFNPVTAKVCNLEEVVSNVGTKDGCMRWYAFLDNEGSTTIKLLLDHNTTESVSWNVTSGATTPDTVTSQLQNDINNWNNNVKSSARLISANEINQIAPKTSSWVQTNSSSYYYFHTGTNYDYYGQLGTNKYAWLFDNTYDCTRYGCNTTDYTNGYWTSSYTSGNYAWGINSRGGIRAYTITDTSLGVRPVIEISKEILKNYTDSYNIKLYLNGGTVSNYSGWEYVTLDYGDDGYLIKKLKYEESTGILPTPTREGYTFTGWYRTSGIKVDGNITANTLNDIIIYAQWEANDYNVTLNLDGGIISNPGEWIISGDTASKIVKYQSRYNLPTPTKEGYQFEGWFKTLSGGNKIEQYTSNYTASDHMIYARWLKISTVTFDVNGGIMNGDTEKTVVYSKQYGTLPEATKEDYTFGGWYTDVTDGEKIESTTIVSTLTDQILYARWLKNYIVTFNANGGSVHIPSKIVAYSNPYGTLPVPTKSNYVFDGWYTDATGGTKITLSTTVNLNSNQTLYAHWRTYFTYGDEIFVDVLTGKKCSPSTYNVSNSIQEYIGIDGTGEQNSCLRFYSITDCKDESCSKISLILDHNTSESAGGIKPEFGRTELVVDVEKWHEDIRTTARLIEGSEVAKITNRSSWTQDDLYSWYYFDSKCITSGVCKAGENKYAWLFDNLSSCTKHGCNSNTDQYAFGYFTNSDIPSYNGYAWSVHRYGALVDSNSAAGSPGVRPVIEMLEVELKK